MSHGPQQLRVGDMLDVDAVNRQIADGFIDRKVADHGRAQLLDYSRRTQLEQHWTAETLVCRGLVATTDAAREVRADDIVLARPFPKFFLPEPHQVLAERGLLPPIPAGESFDVYDKADGSLGVLFDDPVTGLPRVNTRGSFDSPQSRWATRRFREAYAHVPRIPGATYLFEIVYPGNRIVVDYGKFADLLLIGVIDTATGQDLPLPADWPGPCVQAIDPAGRGPLELEHRPRTEGYVVRFASGVRIKVKSDWYKAIHAVVTNTNSVSVWEMLAAGEARRLGIPAGRVVKEVRVDHRAVDAVYADPRDPIEVLVERTPDEFDDWVRAQVAALKAAADARRAHYLAQAARVPSDLPDRKAKSAWIRANLPRAEQGVVWSVLDGNNNLTTRIWREIRPAYVRAWANGED